MISSFVHIHILKVVKNICVWGGMYGGRELWREGEVWRLWREVWREGGYGGREGPVGMEGGGYRGGGRYGERR